MTYCRRIVSAGQLSRGRSTYRLRRDRVKAAGAVMGGWYPSESLFPSPTLFIG